MSVNEEQNGNGEEKVQRTSEHRENEEGEVLDRYIAEWKHIDSQILNLSDRLRIVKSKVREHLRRNRRTEMSGNGFIVRVSRVDSDSFKKDVGDSAEPPLILTRNGGTHP